MSSFSVVTVKGTHYECGFQIGKIFKDQLHQLVNTSIKELSQEKSRSQVLDSSRQYLYYTEKHFPYIVSEFQGAAAGSGLDFLLLFTVGIEELWPADKMRNCTDIIVTRPYSDFVMVGHNNDLSPDEAELVTAVEWKINGDVPFLSFGVSGLFVSAGINSHGIALTGNELTQTDQKIGIPRAYIARAALSSDSLENAINLILTDQRASSYNNILSSSTFSCNIEASGTSYEKTSINDGFWVHANHYLSDSMLSFEGKPNYRSSLMRQSRAVELLSSKRDINARTIKEILSDHGFSGLPSDDTICRHDKEAVSAFGLLIDYNRSLIEACLGNPCTSEFLPVWEIPDR